MSQALWDYLSDSKYAQEKFRTIQEESNMENAKLMLKDGVSVQNAAKWSRLPLDRVQQLAASL